jgi:hypothetical protein
VNDRERRFQRLERARPERSDGEERPASAPRFLGVEAEPRPAAPAAPHQGPAGDRFREPAPRSLEVEREAPGEQPFLRCMRCEADNSRYARACATCGDDLSTPAQRAFNEGLWARRQEERALEDREADLRRQAAEAEAVETARARRLAAEQLAREVGDQERRRLDAADRGEGLGGDSWGRWGGPGGGDGAHGWGGGWGSGDGTPLGVRWLRLIRDPRWRLGVIALGLLVVGGGILLRGFASPFVLGAVLVLAILFSPRRPSRWRRWWW